MRRLAKLSRKERAFVAAALLLPLPLVALESYSAVVPDVGGGLGSLVSLDAEDERTGATASGKAAEEGSGERRSTTGELRISRAGAPVDGRSRLGARVSGGDPGDPESADRPPRDPPSDDGAGESAPAGGSEAGSSEGGAPGVSLEVDGQGSAVTFGANGDGLSVDVEADSAGAVSDEAGSAELEVTDTEGSSNSARVGLPNPGASPP